VYRYFMPALRISLISCLAVAGACAHPRIGVPSTGVGGGAAEAPADKCVLSTGAVAADSPTITIGLTETVDPRHAPVSRNDAERIVFRHLYETPVRADCEGHALPELAEAWSKEDDGRRWTFRLRDGAQFWDGAPVVAQDVVFGKGGVGYTLSVLENRIVGVALAKADDDVPPLLSDAGLAVVKPAPDSSWPIGTGSFWATSASTTAQEIRAFGRGDAKDTLVFKFAASGDARDLLDGGVDLLVTRDRALRDYGATLQDHAVIALPWDRTYVYVTSQAGGTRFDGLEQSVRSDARRAEGGFWWLDLRACGMGQGAGLSPPAPTGQHRILYLRTDPTARELAGRLAALTHGVATGRAADDFDAALTKGQEWGYVVALPRTPSDLCRVAKALLPSWPATFTALIDTRATAIVKRGVARWTLDQDGTVHLAR
jgi:Bacterial extracellular solute-binding proteins, family 5 Middle